MLVRDVMNAGITSIRLGTTMEQAADVLSHSQASDLMVVDDEGCFVGVLSEGDLIRATLPRFEELMQSSGSLGEAFETFVQQGRLNADRPIEPLVIREPVTVKPTDEVLKAASTMVARQIRRLPVVEEGRLVGTISRSDVCLGILQQR